MQQIKNHSEPSNSSRLEDSIPSLLHRSDMTNNDAEGRLVRKDVAGKVLDIWKKNPRKVEQIIAQTGRSVEGTIALLHSDFANKPHVIELSVEKKKN